MKYLTIIASSLAAIFIAGCTSTTVVPQTGNIFTVTALGSTSAKATSAAIAKAHDVCEQQQGETKVLDQGTVYQGMDKSQQTLMRLSNKLFNENTTDDDFKPETLKYKATISFKCESD